MMQADGIADAPAGHDQVVAENAFLLRAQPQDRRARLLIEYVGDELNPDRLPVLKRVSEQQQLRFGVDWSPLGARRNPGVTDRRAALQS